MEIPATLLYRHDQLLQELDRRFHSIQSRYASQMQCRHECARCCHGLFDISIPDAMQLEKGFEKLSAESRKPVTERASAIHRRIMEECADLEPPFFLNVLSEDRIDKLVEEIGDVRCPFLGTKDSCLIYEYRPIACRLEGLPMVDARDGLFSDWCELNFRQGMAPELAKDLRLDYYAIQQIEQDVTLFIPSVIYAIYYGHWNILTNPDL